MNESLEEADCVEITTATRNVILNGVEVKKGKVIGLLNGKLMVAADAVENAVLEILQKIDLDNRERITIFYGSELTEAKANSIAKQIEDKYPDHEIEVHFGGQPLYPIIMSLE